MDRRNLTFIITFSITVLILNLFFSYQQDQNMRVWREENAVEKVALEQKRLEEIQASLPSAKAMKLHTLYDKEGAEHQAVEFDGYFLSLALQGSPSRLWLDSSLQNPVELAKSAQDKAEPVVYAKKKDLPLKILEARPISKLCNQDLYLINAETGQVHLATYAQGQISFPAGSPSSHALVLSTLPNLEPVGVYDAQNFSFHSLSEFSGFAVKLSNDEPLNVAAKTYVLESPQMQLVFSNIGGAVKEINLDLKSEKAPLSVVKAIEVDRSLEKDLKNSQFPLTPSYNYKGERVQVQQGGYYPLIRRDQLDFQGQVIEVIDPKNYACSIHNHETELASLSYEMKEHSKEHIVFEGRQGHRRITKTYRLPKEEGAAYTFELDVKVEGDTQGLVLGSGIPEVELISGASSPLVKYRNSQNGQTRAEVTKPNLPDESMQFDSFRPDWICNSNGFLGLIVDPLENFSQGFSIHNVCAADAPSRLSLLEKNSPKYRGIQSNGYRLDLPLPKQPGTWHFRIFAGPFSEDVLEAVDLAYSKPDSSYNPDYLSCQSYHGWFAFISQPFAKTMLFLMKLFHKISGSWVVSIFLLTLTLRLMLYPLNKWSMRSMKLMQELSPRIQAIQDRYKNNPKKAQMEIMKIYQENKINPLSGCLPLLIQMPFLMGMFDLLKSTFELRGASFIPGWIDNLAAPDVLYTWAVHFPLIGNELHLLPVVLGLSMLVQQRLSSSAPKDPNKMSDQQRQQVAMGNMMAIVFTFLFYNFPSGLNLYWIFSTALALIQQYFTKVSDKKGSVSVVK